MDEIISPRPVPAGWLEALARSDAELAAGLTVPAESKLFIAASESPLPGSRRSGQAARSTGSLRRLIEYTPEAMRQVDALLLHYEERQRDEHLCAPLVAGVTEWPFKGWDHTEGSLRDVPPLPVEGRRLGVPPHITIRIPIRASQGGELELLVPPRYLDFILKHSGFRSLPQPRP